MYIITGRPARSAAMPVLFLLSGPKWVFPLPRAKFHVYRDRNVGIQPPKLSKFRILTINFALRGDSFALFLRNSQRLYTSIGSF